MLDPRPLSRWILFFLALIFFNLAGRPQVFAGEEYGNQEPTLSASDIEERLTFIQVAMNEESRRSKVWMYSWHGAFAAFNVGQGIAIGLEFPSKEDRVDYYYGIGSDLVGHLFLYLFPPKVIDGAETLNRLIDNTPNAQHSLDVLKRGEHLLQLSAQDETESRSLLMHVGNVAFNAGLGLLLGLVHDRWESGIIFFGSGVVIGELFIYTQPHRLNRQLNLYENNQFSINTKKESRIKNWRFSPVLGQNLYGSRISFNF